MTKLNTINDEWQRIEEVNPSIIDALLNSGADQQIPIYTFKGQYIVIVSDSDTVGGLSIYSNGDKHLLPLLDIDKIDTDDIVESYDDELSCYTGIEEITDDATINPYNYQCLVNEFVRLSYYNYDLTKIQLVIETTKYHEWTSARTQLQDECICAINRAWDNYNDSAEDIKEQIENIQAIISERQNLINQYNEINNLYYREEYTGTVPSYNDYITECSSYIDAPDNFCDLFRQ